MTEPIASLRFTKFLRRTVLPVTLNMIKCASAVRGRHTITSQEQRRTSALSMKAISLSLLILASAITVQAKLVTKTVSYEQNGTKLEGYLAYDDSITDKGKVPGILVFPEWWGLNDYIKGRADQLAKSWICRICGGYVWWRSVDDGAGESQRAFQPVLRQAVDGWNAIKRPLTSC